MHRPYETAQIILQNNKDLKIEKIDSLVEISHGLWEGKLEAEIREKWPALLKNWHDKPEEVIIKLINQFKSYFFKQQIL